MSTPPVPFSRVKLAAELWHKALDEGYPPAGGHSSVGALRIVHEGLGYNNASTGITKTILDTAAALGIPVRSWRAIDQGWAEKQRLRYLRHDPEFAQAEAKFGRAPAALPRSRPARRNGDPSVPSHHGDAPSGQEEVISSASNASIHDLANLVIPTLRRGPLTIDSLAEKLGVIPMIAEAAVLIARSRGAQIHERGGVWHLDNAPALGSQRVDAERRILSDDKGVVEVALVGDTHLGSKYAREDCLADFYDEVQRRDIKLVLHAGNWIDGEASFNLHDLKVHGMDAQMKYLADNYPRREGVVTWAIAGADHEGWYSRREGVDVGRYAENHMRSAGRDDWVDLGYMETFIPLVHAASGKAVQLCLMHPGGGSAYAISYAPQKIVEGFDGGDKPAALVLGHYHKASYNLIRNVHVIQTGCFQDQTVFMRQKKLATHLAGCFARFTLDPVTGAVVQCSTEFRNYFVRDYYNNRWSQHGDVKFAVRTP